MDRNTTDEAAEQFLFNMINSGDPGVAEDDVASFLNQSGHGMEESSEEEGQLNEDDEDEDEGRIVGPLITSGEVHILSPLVTRCIKYIYTY